MTKLLLGLVTGLLLVNLTGCASIVSGTSQSVSIKATQGGQDVAAASCKLENDKGVWYVPQSPGSVVIHKSYHDLTVSCDKTGTPAGSSTFSSSAIGMAAGNILFGGAIGIGVDVASGAAYEYPNLMTVEMGVIAKLPVKVAPASASATPNAMFGRVPDTPPLTSSGAVPAPGAAIGTPVVLIATAAPAGSVTSAENFPGLAISGDQFVQHVSAMKAFQARTPGGATLEISMSDQQVWVHNLERGGRATGTYTVDAAASQICFANMSPASFSVMSTCYQLQQLDATTFQWHSVNSKYFLRYVRANS